ncbi:MAG: Hpt domain-containing protein [Treponema sp.]|nr:Hpt domain-containing protein [Treponema sp.]
MAIGLPGVDEGSVLKLFEGDMEFYQTVLRSFIANLPETLNKMRNVTKETLQDYALVAHNINSICASIGAEDARKESSKLEMMAKAGDLPGVLAANEAFLNYMENLLEGFQNWLDNYQNRAIFKKDSLE